MRELHTESDLTGLVFDVKRFALHDGPGIRTTAFLKGCPLSCPWCQNPEGISPKRHLWYANQRCIQCNACVTACDTKALTANPGDSHFIHIDRTQCTLLGSCVEVCPSGALSWDSRDYSVTELVDLFERDNVFYQSSGGGITLSGGEPLYQSEFAAAVLQESASRGLRTALETTLFTSRTVVETVAPFVDHWLVDIKIFNGETHRQTVGVDNKPILKNLAHLTRSGADVTVRIPLIPGITTNVENIRRTAAFVAQLPGNPPLELINFNPLASGKYLALEREYEFATRTSPLSEQEVAELAGVAKKEGVTVVGL